MFIKSNTQLIREGILAVYQYLDDTARQTVPAKSFIVVRNVIYKGINSVDNINRNELAKKHIEIIKSIYETAISNQVPTQFFKQASEIQIDGELLEVAQAQLASRIALAYYFESLGDNVDYDDLQAFRERAIVIKNEIAETIQVLKTQPLQFRQTTNVSLCEVMTKEVQIAKQQAVIDAIDKMIVTLGNVAKHTPTYKLNGTYHALVASYHLYGNVSKAYDLIKWSGAVSGAEISMPIYYKE